MGWITKLFKCCKHKCQHHRRSPSTPPATGSDFDHEEIDHAIALSLVEADEKEYLTNDEDQKRHSVAEQDQNEHCSSEEDQEEYSSSEEDHKGKKVQIDNDTLLEEDEQLAKALQESLTVDSPPKYDYGSAFPPYPYLYPPVYSNSHPMESEFRICAGCHSEIENGRILHCVGAFWHPDCFRCHACHQPISDYEFSMSDNRPYHKYCYKEQHHPKCDVCKNFIQTNAGGLIEYRAHPFWMQKYCPSHENDGTRRCCSCEKMEPVDTRYLILDDGRKLCLECLDSALMDTHECQGLYLEIQEFYEGLNMKVEQAIPLLLVERQALNEAMEGEKNGHHHLPETRGLCLSEEQTVRTISRRPTFGGYRIVDMFTEPYLLTRKCEVTAILILFGLPRLLTGSILAHEMMHAWLRLKGYPNLSPDVEEGICQVLAHMWLDSEIIADSGSSATSTSSSSPSSVSTFSSTSTSASFGSSKKGEKSQFEKKLGAFFKHQIESDTSSAYGDGFREGNQAVLKYGLRRTLDHIRFTGSFPG
ncbi:actin or actin-binding cytoskeletal protein [Lithospermum erythrorhizon]|uniref:Actin or actin-binding cytoskeletal protein n=1 Tax=Lithospermum erythrorhizon TaxID=34254 RepID=A0AAV3Q3B4_LITER